MDIKHLKEEVDKVSKGNIEFKEFYMYFNFKEEL